MASSVPMLPTKTGVTPLLRAALPILLGVGSLSASGGAIATQPPRPTISQLINTGQVGAAAELLERANPSAADRVFFDGRVLKAQSDFAGAIDAFRRVLTIAPNHLNARRELAHTLMLNRDFGPARYHFNALMRIDENARMRSGYQRYLRLIDQNQPAGIGGYIALAPSTNVNRGTTNTVFDTSLGQFVIDPDSKAASGVGVEAGLSGYVRHVLGPDRRLNATWSLAGTAYEDDTYNRAWGSVSLAYEQVTEAGSWSIGPFVTSTWDADDGKGRSHGTRAGLTRRISARDQLGFTISHEYRRFTEQDHRDGAFTRAALRLSHQVSPSLSLGAGVAFERSLPDAEHLKFNARMLSVDFTKAWEGGLTAGLGLEVGARDFVGDYPLTSAPREDEFYEISARLQHSRINLRGFTPTLRCSYGENHSNVAFYDYSATECRANLSRNF